MAIIRFDMSDPMMWLLVIILVAGFIFVRWLWSDL